MKHLAVHVPTANHVNIWLHEWMLKLLRTPNLKVTTGIELGRPTMSSRNRLCLRVVEDIKPDYLLTVDSDQVPYIGTGEELNDHGARASGIELLLDDIARPDVDVVSILTVRRKVGGPEPVIQKLMGENGQDGRLYAEILQKPWGLHSLDPDGAMGAAGLLIKRHVLERFYEEEVLWFKDVYQEKRGERFDPETGQDLYGTRTVGHDVWFFKKCREFGFKTWVDTRVLWGHLKEVDIRDEFVRGVQDASTIAALKRDLGLARRELSLVKNGVAQ